MGSGLWAVLTPTVNPTLTQTLTLKPTLSGEGKWDWGRASESGKGWVKSG